jgi:hypothetical protein
MDASTVQRKFLAAAAGIGIVVLAIDHSVGGSSPSQW